MPNVFTDKYFTKSKLVAANMGLNPIVKYRVFGRFDGIAALEPAQYMIQSLSPTAKVEILPTGTPFKTKDTIMVIEDHFQNIVELETMYLWWSALPCYCAEQAQAIVKAAEGKTVLDFHARHLYDPTSVALASYGAGIGGIKAFSTDVGANSVNYLKTQTAYYKEVLNHGNDYVHNHILGGDRKGVGTTPHALIAIFNGDYEAMANAYINTFPDENFVALIDYNNKEIGDTMLLLENLGDKLYGVRIDTCGENAAEGVTDGKTGVTYQATSALRTALNENGGRHVRLYISSGFNEVKTKEFMISAPNSFDGIGTGSFIPKGPYCTSDIFEVEGARESKVGREWGYVANAEFYSKIS